MSYQKLANWFLTDAGKKFCFYGAGTISTCVLLANFLPHTLLLNQYKSFMQLYRKEVPVALTKKLEERFQKTLDLLEIEEIDKHLYKPFHCFGYDVMSAGSSYSKFGVVIGIPAHFECDDIGMVDTAPLKISNDSIIWMAREAQRLLDTLVLSENAQLFAIAKEIKYRQTPKPLLDTILATSSCLVAYSMGNIINTKFDLYVKPAAARFAIYSLIGLFVAGLYVMTKDMTQIYYEEKIDRELKEMNEIFAEGGKEYYTKTLDRNLYLPKVLGKDGARQDKSIKGDEYTLIRTRHVPLQRRRSFFEESKQA